MRIAHVTATFPPYPGGTGNVCRHQAQGLAEHGHDVTVYTAARGGATETQLASFQVRRLRAWFRVGNAPLLPGLLALDTYDLVHLHYPFYFGAELLLLSRQFGRRPYVVTYHQDTVWQGALGMAAEAYRHSLGYLSLRCARRLLVTSWDYAQHCALRGSAALQRHMVALANGVDVRRFRPDIASTVRAKYDIASAAAVILFVGGLDRAHYFKGVDVLLHALARLGRRDVRLLIVGEGDLRGRYQSLCAQLNLTAQVIFCGHVPDDALPATYAASDLLVLPSTTMGEAFGLVLLEAMASGKAVIASNLPGVRSVVSDGVDGLLAEPGSATNLSQQITTLLDDQRRMRAMGERGRSKVEHLYDWSILIPQLEQVYAQALAAKDAA